jgi:hypothetical protein
MRIAAVTDSSILLFDRHGPYFMSTGKHLPSMQIFGQLLKNIENLSESSVADVTINCNSPFRFSTAFLTKENSISV